MLIGVMKVLLRFAGQIGEMEMYRAEKKSWYVVARNFFLLFLNFSAWTCLGPA